jgi:sugar phosphate isomerase/epimerase
MVSRHNGYDYPGAARFLAELCESMTCDGVEFMMLPIYYEKLRSVADTMRDAGLYMPVLHCEKEVGTHLSNAAAAYASGDRDAAKSLREQSLEEFRMNCEMCGYVGAGRTVLHLWGGHDSDSNVKYNIEAYGELDRIANEAGVRIMCENIPCTTHDPLSNWRLIENEYQNVDLVLDTRFSKFHDQLSDIFSDSSITPHIRHCHISDYGGTLRQFSALRPILHPGEGKVDFGEVERGLDEIGFDSSITLETPVVDVNTGAVDIEKLRRTANKIRELLF